MGLTVYYDFHLPLAVSAQDVRMLLERWRNFAAELGVGQVTPVHSIEPDDIFARRTVSKHDRLSGTERCYAVPVLEGWQFVLQPAARCETLRIALCRCPASIRCDGRLRRTRLDGGWCYHSFCKTQYASLSGWEIFLAVHRAVVACLAQGRTYGVRVRIRDDGGYWPRRDERTLRARLDEMNGIVAAVEAMTLSG